MVEVPCRLGEQFRAGGGGLWTLTEISFYKWGGSPAGNINVGTRDRWKRGRMTTQTIYAQQTSAETRYTAALPDEAVEGAPLALLGLDTDAVGRLQAIQLTEHGGHRYVIYYGREPGSPPTYIKSEVLDQLFQEILPRRAINVDLKSFL